MNAVQFIQGLNRGGWRSALIAVGLLVDHWPMGVAL